MNEFRAGSDVDFGHDPPHLCDVASDPRTIELGRDSWILASEVVGVLPNHELASYLRDRPRGDTVQSVVLLRNGQRLPGFRPASELHEQWVNALRAAEADRGPRLALGTVLVVEDEAMVRAMVRRALEGARYATLEASDGEEALQLLEAQGAAVQLLLTDLQMPRMGGLELGEHVARRYPDKKLAYMSGQAVDDPQIGRSTFLQKPFDIPSLLDTINRSYGFASPLRNEDAA